MARPRKHGDRYPSGDLKRTKRPSLKPDLEPISGPLWQRLRQHGKQLGADPRLTSELGRLSLYGELTVAMTAAGFKIAEIYGRYEGLRGLRRSTKSPSYNASYGDAGLAEELMDVKTLAEFEDKIRSASEAFERLVGHAAVWDGERLLPPSPGLIPPHMRNAIETLCVQDQPISPALYEAIRGILLHLAVTWNIQTGQISRGSSNNGRATRGPALHFNKHEDGPDPATPPPARPPSADRIAVTAMIRKLNPKLDDDAIEQAYDLSQALKAREQFRRDKHKTKRAAHRT